MHHTLVRFGPMKAARLHRPRGPVTIEDIPQPAPGPGEVLVRTEACGLCHSDVFIRSLERLPKTPLTLGHEVIGVIDRAGPEAGDWKPGDRVGLTYLFGGCEACEACLAGHPEMCPRQLNTGYHADGGFADYVVARAGSLVRVPTELAAQQAAPLCCAGWTAYHAVQSVDLDPGSLVAIFGIGGLGHLGIQFARLRGFRVAAVDLADEKLAIAAKLGAEITINASEGDPARALRKEGGAHAAISFVAAASVIRQAFKSLRRNGTLVLVGLEVADFELPLVDTILKQIRVQGSFLGTRRELRKVFDLARQGKIRMETTSCPLEDLPDGMKQMESGRLAGRLVVDFSASGARSVGP